MLFHGPLDHAPQHSLLAQRELIPGFNFTDNGLEKEWDGRYFGERYRIKNQVRLAVRVIKCSLHDRCPDLIAG